MLAEESLDSVPVHPHQDLFSSEGDLAFRRVALHSVKIIDCVNYGCFKVVKQRKYLLR